MRVIIVRACLFLALSCFLATFLQPVHQCRVPHSRDPRELRPGQPAALITRRASLHVFPAVSAQHDRLHPLSKSLNHSSEINTLEPHLSFGNWLP